jgi:2-oxoglutarate ferredoxin oxidoreductase subunit alpha
VQGGFIVEQSHQGQLYRVSRMFVDLPTGVESFARSGSNPFAPGDIVDRLRAKARAILEEPQTVSQAE